MKYDMQKSTLSYKSYIVVIFFISSLTLYVLYLQSCTQYDQNYLTNTVDYSKNSVIKTLHPTTAYYTSNQKSCNGTDANFLICSSKCMIPDLNPFNSDLEHLYSPHLYHSCSKLPLLTYATVIDNKAVLYINKGQIFEYSDNGVNCCYKTVKRKLDSSNRISKCKNFVDNVTISEDIVAVICDDSYTNKTVYKNIHAVVTIDKKIEAKINSSKDIKPLSILCIGIDSVSRLNYMRLMKKTSRFIKEREFVELHGYNKIADNTFPNLMGIFGGMNLTTSYKLCNPNKAGSLDRCRRLLLYEYRKYGFVTAYAEDEAKISTFNYLKKGFITPPADYYFRPYILATETELKFSTVDGMHYCTGPESSGERILNLAKSFASTFSANSYFGFFWMNSFSHNQLNSLSRMDEKVFNFFEELWNTEVLNNTIVIFLSDHGMRFGDILYTQTGWLEARLPMFFVSFPKSFIEDYPEKYENFKINSNRLTTPYDVYMTLQDLLVISGKNYTVVPSSACPKCKSLFEEMDFNRSCEDAAIDQHWCTCGGYLPIEKSNTTVQKASQYVLEEIQDILDSYGLSSLQCANFELNKIVSASISDNLKVFYKNDTYLILVIKTKPSAVFEATVSVQTRPNNLNIFKLEGSISRLDSYQSHSGCVKHSRLAQYCYCK